MKITVFASNQKRHNCLINILYSLCSELFVAQEADTLFSGLNLERYSQGPIFYKYFQNVLNAKKNLYN